MMMRDLEDFLPHVIPFAPGCPEPTAISALRDAAMEFCRETRLWRSDDEFQVSPGSCDVICVPAGAQLVEIEHATFDGAPLTPKAVADLDREYPSWREETDTTTLPSYLTQLSLDTVTVVPAGTGTLRLYTILTLSDEADSAPGWLFQKYAKVIAAGALKEILMLPGQPFFNADLAAGFSSRFYGALDKNFAMSSQGQQRAPLRTRPHFF